MIVPIDTHQFDRYAVDQKLLSCDLHVAESYLAATRFDDPAGRVVERKDKRMQSGLLGTPFPGRLHPSLEEGIIHVVEGWILFVENIINRKRH